MKFTEYDGDKTLLIIRDDEGNIVDVIELSETNRQLIENISIELDKI